MELPDFELGPLEMEELAALEAGTVDANARVQIGNSWFLLRGWNGRNYGAVIFLRLDVPDSPILVASCKDAIKALSRIKKNPQRTFQQQAWHRKLDSGRQSQLGLPLQLRVYADFAEWIVAKDLNDNFSAARWKLSSSFDWLVHANNLDIGKRVEEALQYSSGDCAFSLAWIEWSDNQKMSKTTRLLKGNWQEFDSVLRSIAWCFCADDLRENSAWDVDMGIRDDARVDEWDKSDIHSAYYLEAGDEDDHELGDDAIACLRIAHLFFRPCHNHTLLNYSVVQELDEHDSFARQIEVPVPTQHERLEARLRLREWLRGKVAPNEIPALLGEA